MTTEAPQPTARPTAQHDDDAAVRELHASLLRRWNRRDAHHYAALFTPDGSVVGFDGSMMDGQTEIASTLAGIFAEHATGRYVAKVREVRRLAPEVALLRAVAGMVPHGQNDLKPELNAVQSLVAVRRDQGWRIALFQNTPAAFHGRPEASVALTEELRTALRG